MPRSFPGPSGPSKESVFLAKAGFAFLQSILGSCYHGPHIGHVICSELVGTENYDPAVWMPTWVTLNQVEAGELLFL